MKRKKSIIVLLCILAVAIIAFLCVKGYQRHQDKIKTSGDTIISFDVDDVTHIDWAYGSTISNSFTKTDGVWHSDNDEAMPVDEEALEDIIAILKDYRASFVIDEPENLSDYELKTSKYTVNITISGTSAEKYTNEGAVEGEDGSKTIPVMFGGYSTMDEQRYFSVGDGKVYLAVEDAMDSFNVEAKSLVKLDTLPEFGKVISFDLSGENNLSIYYFEDSSYAYSKEFKYFLKTETGYTGIYSDYALEVINVVTGMYLGTYKTYTADTDDLSVYGLENPAFTVTLIYLDDDEEQQSFVMYIGKNGDSVYARMEGSNFVFLIDSADYDTLAEADLTTLRSKYLEDIDWTKVSKVTAVLGNDVYDIEFSTDKNGTATYKYKGEDADAYNVRNTLDSITITEYNSEVDHKKKEVGLIIYQDNDAYPQITIEFYRIDGDSCAVYFMGDLIGTVYRSKVVDLVEYIYDVVLM